MKFVNYTMIFTMIMAFTANDLWGMQREYFTQEEQLTQAEQQLNLLLARVRSEGSAVKNSVYAAVEKSFDALCKARLKELWREEEVQCYHHVLELARADEDLFETLRLMLYMHKTLQSSMKGNGEHVLQYYRWECTQWKKYTRLVSAAQFERLQLCGVRRNGTLNPYLKEVVQSAVVIARQQMLANIRGAGGVVATDKERAQSVLQEEAKFADDESSYDESFVDELHAMVIHVRPVEKWDGQLPIPAHFVLPDIGFTMPIARAYAVVVNILKLRLRWETLNKAVEKAREAGGVVANHDLRMVLDAYGLLGADKCAPPQTLLFIEKIVAALCKIHRKKTIDGDQYERISLAIVRYLAGVTPDSICLEKPDIPA